MRNNPFPPNKAKSTDDASKRKQAPFDFSSQNADGDDLSDLDLRHVNFKGASLVGASFEQSNLSGVDLSGADLRGANFRNADLSKANLSNAKIDEADFSSADMQKSNLLGIVLPHELANFENADVTGLLTSDEQFVKVAEALQSGDAGWLPGVSFTSLAGKAPTYAFRLPAAAVQRYHRELKGVLERHGVDAFRIGGGGRTATKQLSVCCGGPTAARLKGFMQLTGVGEDVPQTTIDVQGGSVHIRNSLIGYMLARVVVLFFSSKTDYTKWLVDGVEASFLTLTQPANRDKHFVVVCSQPLPLDEIQALTNAGSISTSLDWAGALNQLGDYISPGFGGMVLVPSGELDGTAIDTPFLMSQAEVTQDLYESVMGTNPSHFEGGSRPVEQVSWFDMLRFANALSGASACYTNIVSGHDGSADWVRGCTGLRLPTAREWEYAARAISPFAFSGSDRAVDVGWCDPRAARTHPVGQLKPNAFGIYDMSGNVWEWCWDLYAPRSADRVLRGGSWWTDAWNMRVSLEYIEDDNDDNDGDNELGCYESPYRRDTMSGGRLSRSLS